MRIVVLCAGRVKERGIREAIDEYLVRARRHVAVEERELRAGDPRKMADAFARAVPGGARLVALAADGRALGSEAFARLVERLGSSGKGVVAFAIGGPDGLPAVLLDRADERLSLGPLTLPHRLARLVLAEQIYRATTILRGEPYAR